MDRHVQLHGTCNNVLVEKRLNELGPTTDTECNCDYFMLKYISQYKRTIPQGTVMQELGRSGLNEQVPKVWKKCNCFVVKVVVGVGLWQLSYHQLTSSFTRGSKFLCNVDGYTVCIITDIPWSFGQKKCAYVDGCDVNIPVLSQKSESATLLTVHPWEVCMFSLLTVYGYNP